MYPEIFHHPLGQSAEMWGGGHLPCLPARLASRIATGAAPGGRNAIGAMVCYIPTALTTWLHRIRLLWRPSSGDPGPSLAGSQGTWGGGPHIPYAGTICASSVQQQPML